MDKPRKNHLQEMRDLRTALEKTRSPYARRDLQKALKRKENELREYDRWRRN